MNKLKDNIDPNYVIFLSEWWGLGNNPGAVGFFIYPDGRYIRKKIKFIYDSNRIELESQKEGTLGNENFEQLASFIGEHVRKNTENVVFDMGCAIEVKSEEGVVEIKNDMELFKSIIELIPFREREDNNATLDK